MKKEIEPIYEFLDEKATLEDIRTIVKMCDTFWSLRDPSYYEKKHKGTRRNLQKMYMDEI